MLLPLVINLFAKLIGLGGLAKKVMKIFTKIRKRIDKAVNKILAKAKAAGRKILGKLGLGKKTKNKKGEEVKHDPAKQKKIDAGLKDLQKEEKKYLTSGKISHEEAEKVAKTIKAKHSVFSSFKVKDGKETWDYEYAASPKTVVEGEKKEEGDEEIPVSVKDLIKAKYNKGQFLADVTKIDKKKKEILHVYRYEKLTKNKELNTFSEFNKKWKNGDIEKVNEERRYLMQNRPSYEAGLVDKVWNNAKNPAGKVFDPNLRPRKELFWDKSKGRFDQWHMGHRTGYEYKDLVDKYIIGKVSREEFISDYNNAKNYYPEDPKANMSHKFESK